jgi:hypothetical protein
MKHEVPIGEKEIRIPLDRGDCGPLIWRSEISVFQGLEVGRVGVTHMRRPDMRSHDAPFDQVSGHNRGHVKERA